MRMRLSYFVVNAAVVVLLWPLGVHGQQSLFFEDDEGAKLWGVSGSYTTRWVSPKQSRWLMGAEHVDLQGSDYRFGFVRGRPLGGEWGVSYVRQVVNEGSEVQLSTFPDDIGLIPCTPETFDAGDCGVFYETNGGLILRGFEFHGFAPFATFSDRVQVGMNIAGGGGWYQGTATRRVVSDELVGESVSEVMGSEFTELTLPRSFNTPVPMFNVDLAVAAILPRGVKVRGGVGLFGLPGRRVAVASATYFFGAE